MIIRAHSSQAGALADIEKTQPYASGWGVDGFAGELKLDCAWVWGYEQEGKLVGFLALRSAGGLAEILNVAVLPSCTGKGVGNKLLCHALGELKKQSVEKVTLEVAVENVLARRLYEKVGFDVLGQRKDFYGVGKDGLIMGLDL